MRWECRERFPCNRLQRKVLVSDPSMHHGTCVTHVPWCMSGSLTRAGHSRRMRNIRNFDSLSTVLHEICTNLSRSVLLTLKQLGHFLQTGILFWDVVYYRCNNFVWNRYNAMDIWSALWMQVAWCFITRSPVAIMLSYVVYGLTVLVPCW